MYRSVGYICKCGASWISDLLNCFVNEKNTALRTNFALF